MKKYEKYHTDGSMWAKGFTTKGAMDGYWEWFRKDGSKMRSGHFKNGKQMGVWTTYDKTGKVVKVTTMKFKVVENIDKAKIKSMTVCSRGHSFNKSKENSICPKCWPGCYKKNK